MPSPFILCLHLSRLYPRTFPYFRVGPRASSPCPHPLFCVCRLVAYHKAGHEPTRRQLAREPKGVRKLLGCLPHVVLREGVVYRRIMGEEGEVHQLILPGCLRERMLVALHEGMGHQGVERTAALLRARFYWPSLQGDVERHLGKCQRCLLAKAGRKVVSPMGSLQATHPLEVLAMDYTMLEPGSGGLENVLILTDVFTKFTQAIPTRDQRAGAQRPGGYGGVYTPPTFLGQSVIFYFTR